MGKGKESVMHQHAATRPGFRLDPEDKQQRNFTDVWQKYSHFFNEKEILDYWDNSCKSVDDEGEADKGGATTTASEATADGAAISSGTRTEESASPPQASPSSC